MVQSAVELLAFLLLLSSLALYWFAFRKRISIGLPKGRVVYLDTDHLNPNNKNFYDSKIGLTGKPDYLVKSGNQIIPVEIKSSQAPAAPYDSHILQLGAYCRLVQSQLGIRPNFGIIHYSNRTFKIPYSFVLEIMVLDTVKEIDSQANQGPCDRSHNSTQQCQHCGYRENCDQRLL